jgi:hypothetical protein
MSPIPNTTQPQQNFVMGTTDEITSPTGVDAFDTHFNFNNDCYNNNNNNNNNNYTDDGPSSDKVTTNRDHHHHSSFSNSPKSSIQIQQQYTSIIITTTTTTTTISPLLEQHPIEIQIAAMEFIKKPTSKNWKWLVHLFRLKRWKEEEEKEEEEEEYLCDDVTVMPGECLESDSSVHIFQDFDVAYYENEEGSFNDNYEFEEVEEDGGFEIDEQCVDNDSEESDDKNNNKEDEEETEVAEEEQLLPVDSNKEAEDKEEEEERTVTIKEEEEEKEPINYVGAKTRRIIKHTIISSNNSSSKLLTDGSISTKCDHRDRIAAFRLIYQLLWLSKAWVALTTFVNRFCTRRR